MTITVSAIETLICRREMSLIGSTSFGFCTKYDTWFSKYRIELIVALSSTNATKSIDQGQPANLLPDLSGNSLQLC